MVSRGIKCVRHEQRVGGMRGMRGTRGESQQQARAGLPPTRHVEVSIRRGFCKSVQQKPEARESEKSMEAPASSPLTPCAPIKRRQEDT